MGLEILDKMNKIAKAFGNIIHGDDTKGGTYKDKLAILESSNNYNENSVSGIYGKYQFGNSRLDDYRKATKDDFSNEKFLNDPQLQETVMDWSVTNIDDYINQYDLEKYIGKKIKGITITREGIYAGAHLGGRFGMRKFLESEGKDDPKDKFKTTISNYFEEFSN